MDWALYFFSNTGNNPLVKVSLHSLEYTIIRKVKEKNRNFESCLPNIIFGTYMTQMPQKTHSYFEVQENISW